MYLLAQTKDAWPLSIINKTNNVIILLWTDLTFALSERFKSNFSEAEKCYNSDEYKEALDILKGSVKRNLQIIEGI